MREMTFNVLGAGIVSDGVATVEAFAERVGAINPWRELIGRAGERTTVVGAGQDTLCQLALQAIDQAWRMAGLSKADDERVGLIVQTAWGTIDSTAAYLESMLEAEGRYASPRHFSRSVYSSVASVAAIEFGIRGPCETLVFDKWPLLGALKQAWRLLAMQRCERVVVVWCEQGGALAADLAKRAAEKLGRREFERYGEGLGYGAVAMVCGLEGGLARVDLAGWEEGRFVRPAGVGRPFAMDGAVGLLEAMMNGDPSPRRHGGTEGEGVEE